MIRRILFGLAIAGGMMTLAPSADAQFLNQSSTDPFSLYYGFYLPRQAALAAQPTTPQMLNEVAVARQNIVQQDRSGLYDPIASPFDMQNNDPLSPFSTQRREPLPSLAGAPIGGRSASTPAPVNAFNRTARYFPTHRGGSSANANAVMRGSARSGSPFMPNPMGSMGGMMGGGIR